MSLIRLISTGRFERAAAPTHLFDRRADAVLDDERAVDADLKGGHLVVMQIAA